MFEKSIGFGLTDGNIYGNFGPFSVNTNGDAGIGVNIPGTNFRVVKNIKENYTNGATKGIKKNVKINFKLYACLTIFLGMLGIHKFYIKRYFIGIIYMFTLGLLLIGYFIDIFKLIGMRKIMKKYGIDYLYI